MDVEKVYSKLDVIEQVVIRLEEAVKNQEHRVTRELEFSQKIHDAQQKQLDEHDHTLYGNGKPGQTTRVDKLEDKMADVFSWVRFGVLTVVGVFLVEAAKTVMGFVIK